MADLHFPVTKRFAFLNMPLPNDWDQQDDTVTDEELAARLPKGETIGLVATKGSRRVHVLLKVIDVKNMRL